MHPEFLSSGLLQLLLLVIVANGAPIILRDVLHERFHTPLDGGKLFIDGQRWLGDSKTWRGVIGSVVVTAVAAWLMGLPAATGASVGALAMSGDILASFTKRRLRLAPSSMAPLLDQIPESLLPALAFRRTFNLDIISVLALVGLFIVFELSVSVILYRMGIRKRPY